MQDWEQLDEIESLGEEEEPLQEWEEPGRPPESGGLTGVPLLQAAICAIAVAAVLYLRATGHPAYGEIAGRYRAEQSQEIDLDRITSLFQKEAGQPSASPPVTPSPTPDRMAGLLGPGVQQL